jgi:hypothetical protein
MSQELVDAYMYASQRSRSQQEAIAVLSSTLELPQMQITRRRLDGEELVNAMVEDLTLAIDAMP